MQAGSGVCLGAEEQGGEHEQGGSAADGGDDDDGGEAEEGDFKDHGYLSFRTVILSPFGPAEREIGWWLIFSMS